MNVDIEKLNALYEKYRRKSNATANLFSALFAAAAVFVIAYAAVMSFFN